MEQLALAALVDITKTDVLERPDDDYHIDLVT